MKNRKNGGYIGFNKPSEPIRPDSTSGIFDITDVYDAESSSSTKFTSDQTTFSIAGPAWSQSGSISSDPYAEYVQYGVSTPTQPGSNFSDETGRWNDFGEFPAIPGNPGYGARAISFVHPSNKYYSTKFIDTQDKSLTVPDTASLRFGQGPFTIEFWFKRDMDNDGYDHYFCAKGNATGNTGWVLFLRTDYRIQFDNGSNSMLSGIALQRDVWYHIAVVREGTGAASTLKMYINGTLTATGWTYNAARDDYNQTDPLYIGGMRNNASLYRLYGQLCDLRISNTAIYTSNTATVTSYLENNANVLYSIRATDFSHYIREPNLQPQGRVIAATNEPLWRVPDAPMNYDNCTSYPSHYFDSSTYLYGANAAPDVSEWTGNVTMEVWALAEAYGGDTTSIFQAVGPGVGRSYGIFQNQNRAGLSIVLPNSDNTANILIGGLGDWGNANVRLSYPVDGNYTGEMSTGKWHHIAFTYEQGSGLANVFLDGTLTRSTNVGSLTLFGNKAAGTGQDIHIASRSVASQNKFRGWVYGATITEGLKYTANFIPSREPTPVYSNTLFTVVHSKNEYFKYANATSNVDLTTSIAGAARTPVRVDGNHTPLTNYESEVALDMYHPGQVEKRGLLHYEKQASFYNNNSDSEVVYPSLKPSDTSLNLGNSNFVLETWILPNWNDGSGGIVGRGNTTHGWSFEFGTVLNNRLTFKHGSYGNALTVNTAQHGNVQVGCWNHVAIQRTGLGTNETYMYLNGQVVGRITVPGNLDRGSTARPLFIMNTQVADSAGNTMVGDVCMFRISKDTTRYPTGNVGDIVFSPPTTAFTPDNNTSLLLHQYIWPDYKSGFTYDLGYHHLPLSSSNYYKYESTWNPLTHDSGWSYAIRDGSTGWRVYATNTGGAIEDNFSDFTFGTGDFSIECFLNQWNPTVTYVAPNTMIFDTRRDNAPNDDSPYMHINSQGYLTFYYAAAAAGRPESIISSKTRLDLRFSWYHVVVQRTNGKLALYVNGVKENEVVFTTNMNCRSHLMIGYKGAAQEHGGSSGFYGHLSNFRVYKGKSAYGISDYNPDRIKVPTETLSGKDPNCVLLTLHNPLLIDESQGSRNRGNKLLFADLATASSGSWSWAPTVYSPFKRKKKTGYIDNTSLFYGSSSTANVYWRERDGAQSGATLDHVYYYLGAQSRPYTIEGFCWGYQVAYSGNTFFPSIMQTTDSGGSTDRMGFRFGIHAVNGDSNNYGGTWLQSWSETGGANLANSGGSSHMGHCLVHFVIVYDPTATSRKYAVWIQGRLVTWGGDTASYNNTNYTRQLLQGINLYTVKISGVAKYSGYHPYIKPPLGDGPWPIDYFTNSTLSTLTNHVNPGYANDSLSAALGSTTMSYGTSKFGKGSIRFQNNSTQSAGGFYTGTTPPWGYRQPENIQQSYWGEAQDYATWGWFRQDFTTECWAAWTPSSSPNDRYVFEMGNGNAIRAVSGNYSFRWGNDDIYSYPLGVAVSGSGIFDHICVQRKAGNYMIFINGILRLIVPSDNTFTRFANANGYNPNDDFSNTAQWHFGRSAEGEGAKCWIGHLEDIRITRTARYDVAVINGVSTMVHRQTNRPALPTKPFATDYVELTAIRN